MARSIFADFLNCYLTNVIKMGKQALHWMVNVELRDCVTQSDPARLVRLFPERSSVYVLHARRFHSPSVESNAAPTKAPTGSGTLRVRSQAMAKCILR
jgi:hypothetical protein